MRIRLPLLTVIVAIATMAATRAQQGPKVLLLYDMEGVTDAIRPQDVSMGSQTYPATRESLTEDVNAAIRGLVKAGAREVVLTDGHGSGNPDPDYLLDTLPKGARFDIRDAPYDPYIEAMDATFDAMVTVAMHGKAGGKGFLAHTYNGHTRWVMAGHDMNESMLVAASAARFNVPLILVTGDDVLREEIRAFSPETEYVTVKKAVSVSAAEARPRADVSRDIEAAAERALVEQRVPLAATVLKVPHHGAATSSTAPFLAAVRPVVAVISVGTRNAYGHPDAGALGRLAAAGARVYRTDRHGAVVLETDGRALMVTRWVDRRVERLCLDPESIC